MTSFVKCLRAGRINGNLMFEVAAQTGPPITFAMSTECFLNLSMMGWKAAEALPPAARHGEAPGFETKASFAVVDMSPGLALMSGPLVLTMKLDEQQMASLRSEAATFQSKADKSQKH